MTGRAPEERHPEAHRLGVACGRTGDDEGAVVAEQEVSEVAEMGETLVVSELAAISSLTHVRGEEGGSARGRDLLHGDLPRINHAQLGASRRGAPRKSRHEEQDQPAHGSRNASRGPSRRPSPR